MSDPSVDEPVSLASSSGKEQPVDNIWAVGNKRKEETTVKGMSDDG